jgi:hypothetical protein
MNAAYLAYITMKKLQILHIWGYMLFNTGVRSPAVLHHPIIETYTFIKV